MPRAPKKTTKIAKTTKPKAKTAKTTKTAKTAKTLPAKMPEGFSVVLPAFASEPEPARPAPPPVLPPMLPPVLPPVLPPATFKIDNGLAPYSTPRKIPGKPEGSFVIWNEHRTYGRPYAEDPKTGWWNRIELHVTKHGEIVLAVSIGDPRGAISVTMLRSEDGRLVIHGPRATSEDGFSHLEDLTRHRADLLITDHPVFAGGITGEG